MRLVITGKQTDPEGHTQTTTSVYEAVRLPHEKGHLFRYRAEDGREATLFVSRDLVYLKKGGGDSGGRTEETSADSGAAGEMVFDPFSDAIRCDYATPYGTIPMEIRTDRITILGNRSRRLQARVIYRLTMDPDYTMDCSVTIRAEEPA